MSNKKYITDVFVDGARKGWNMSVGSILPNVMMAFILIAFLKMSGLLDVLGEIFKPVMALWGLPGEAALVLFGALMSMGGGAGVAASLFSQNALDLTHIAMLVPSIYLSGSYAQYLGRILGVLGMTPKAMGVIVCIGIINSLLALTLMTFII